jgi:hypothetical protein
LADTNQEPTSARRSPPIGRCRLVVAGSGVTGARRLQ